MTIPLTRLLAVVLAVLLTGSLAGAAQTDTAEETEGGGQVFVLTVEGAIGPATTDYLTRGFEHAAEAGASLVILELDTPGGLTAATRDIVKAIDGAAVPVVTYVSPGGAQAASAGTYILYASHVAAMAPATNVGAATPVQIGGGGMPGSQPDKKDGEDTDDSEKKNSDKEEPSDAAPQGEAMKRKAINDAAAWIRGLAQKRGRNAEWAEKAVREAVSITAEEALEKKVIEIVARDLGDLLEQLDGREVRVRGQSVTLETAGLTVERLDPDWRSQLLAVITNPTIAYLLLMIGIYGLIFEGYNPGAIVPGVVGGICLLTALYALQVLPVNYAGLLLIALGIVLMVAEAFAPSFGALGLGGIIALIVGSIILMDTDVPGFGIDPYVISTVAVVSGLVFLFIMTMAVKAWRRPVVSGREQLEGSLAEALEDFEQQGPVLVMGERWNAVTRAPVGRGQRVRIDAVDGLTLRVHPVPEDSADAEPHSAGV